MKHTALFVEFWWFLPTVISIQISNPNPPRTFLSSNGMFCAEAPRNTANAALSLYKSMPRGTLYDGIKVSKHKSCQELGYKHHAGEDPCYPTLHTFYRNEKEVTRFYNVLQRALKKFGRSNNLTIDDVRLMDSCKCEENSYVKINITELFGRSCDTVLDFSAHNSTEPNISGKKDADVSSHNLRTFISSNKMFCAQAPKSVANDALNLFKSMPRGKLYDASSLSKHTSCEELGYRSSAGDDPCYPGLQTFYHSKAEGDQFYNEYQATLQEFGEEANVTLEDANLMDSCRCKDSSYAKRNLGKWYTKSCDAAKQLSSRNLGIFISSDKLLCAQAPHNVATDALNLFKSMFRGKLYNGTLLNKHKSCEDLGYKSSGGEDECYPGLKTFYRNKKERTQFNDELQRTLKQVGEHANVTLEDVNFMDSCKCKEKSYAKNNIGKLFNKSCDMAVDSSPNSPFTFISSSTLFCAQAPKSIANHALKLFKSMPRGELYDGTMLRNHTTCGELGYKLSAGEDPCYPGLQTFYRNKEDEQQFFNELQGALKDFGQTKDVNVDDANFMDTCKCKEKSYAKHNIMKLFNKSCDAAPGLFARNPQRSFVSRNKLFCAQGPHSIASDALKLFQNMPRGKLYDDTMLNLHASCQDLGYNLSAGEDPCYPKLKTFYRNEEEGTQFFKELQNHLKVFGEGSDLSLDDANFMDSCKCKEKSYAKRNIGKLFNKSCDKSTEFFARNPVRAFVSKSKLFCAQGPRNTANDALNLFKTMPRGKLYDGTMLRNHTTCGELGYKLSAGVDPCHPGLITFYRDKKDEEQFYNELQSTLQEFGKRKNMTLDDANLMDSCRCKDKSYARKFRGDSCRTVRD